MSLKLKPFLLMTPNCSSGRKHPRKAPHPWSYLSFFFLWTFSGTCITSPKAQEQLKYQKTDKFVVAVVVLYSVKHQVKSSHVSSVNRDLELSEWRRSKRGLKAVPGTFVSICRHGYERLNQLQGNNPAKLPDFNPKVKHNASWGNVPLLEKIQKWLIFNVL